MHKSLKCSSVMLASLLFSCAAFGAVKPVSPIQSLTLKKPKPRVFVDWAVSHDYPVLSGSALFPVFYDDTHLFYGSVEGNYAQRENTSFEGLGAGYRFLQPNQAVWGTYLFFDRNQTQANNYFMVSNLGFERLGERFDLRLNGYLPTSRKRWVEKQGWADTTFGQNEYVTFGGHNQYNRWLKEFEEVGPGADIEAGYHFKSLGGLSVYAGGYHFNLHNTDNVNGGEARATYDLNRYFSVEVSDSYDNAQKNTFALGLRLAFGGLDQARPDLQSRLFDRVSHYESARNNGNSIPVVTAITPSGGPVVETSNLWFITPGSNNATATANATADGTYEHPYTALTQGVINDVASKTSNATLYVKQGTYNLGGQVTIASGMTLDGRTSDYKQDVSGSSRPTLQGSLCLTSGDSLNNLILENDKNNRQSQGIYIQGTGADLVSNVSLDHVQIGSLTDVDKSFDTAIHSYYAQDVLIQNSEIDAYSKTAVLLQGIDADHATLTLENSNVSVALNAGDLGSDVSVRGIFLDSSSAVLRKTNLDVNSYLSGDKTNTVYGVAVVNSILNLQEGSQVTATGLSTGDGAMIAFGIKSQSSRDIVTVDGGSLVKATANSTGGPISLVAVGISGDGGTVNVLNQSVIQALSTSAGFPSEIYSILSQNAATINVQNSTLTASGNAVSIGIFVLNGGKVTALNNQFNITAQGVGFGGFGYGIYTEGGAMITQSSNTFVRDAPIGEDVYADS